MRAVWEIKKFSFPSLTKRSSESEWHAMESHFFEINMNASCMYALCLNFDMLSVPMTGEHVATGNRVHGLKLINQCYTKRRVCLSNVEEDDDRKG